MLVPSPQPTSSRPRSIFKRSYDETLDLMIEARNYMAHRAPHDRRELACIDRLKVSCEAFRVTSRLTQVMAWLMAQRAVEEGELTMEEACEQFGLSGHDVCLDESHRDDQTLPRGLRSLLDRSRQLYVRIARLDEMVRRRTLH